MSSKNAESHVKGVLLLTSFIGLMWTAYQVSVWLGIPPGWLMTLGCAVWLWLLLTEVKPC